MEYMFGISILGSVFNPWCFAAVLILVSCANERVVRGVRWTAESHTLCLLPRITGGL